MKNLIISLVLVLAAWALAFAGAEAGDAAVDAQSSKNPAVAHKVRVEEQPREPHAAVQKASAEQAAPHAGEVTIKGKAGIVTSVGVGDPAPAPKTVKKDER